jgi:hypothetical protein
MSDSTIKPGQEPQDFGLQSWNYMELKEQIASGNLPEGLTTEEADAILDYGMRNRSNYADQQSGLANVVAGRGNQDPALVNRPFDGMSIATFSTKQVMTAGEWFESVPKDHPSRLPIKSQEAYLLSNSEGTNALVYSRIIKGKKFVFFQVLTEEVFKKNKRGNITLGLFTAELAHIISDPSQSLSQESQQTLEKLFSDKKATSFSYYTTMNYSRSGNSENTTTVVNDSFFTVLEQTDVGDDFPKVTVQDFALYSDAITLAQRFPEEGLEAWYLGLTIDDVSVIESQELTLIRHGLAILVHQNRSELGLSPDAAVTVGYLREYLDRGTKSDNDFVRTIQEYVENLRGVGDDYLIHPGNEHLGPTEIGIAGQEHLLITSVLSKDSILGSLINRDDLERFVALDPETADADTDKQEEIRHVQAKVSSYLDGKVNGKETRNLKALSLTEPAGFEGRVEEAVVPTGSEELFVASWFDSLGDDHPSRLQGIEGRKVYLMYQNITCGFLVEEVIEGKRFISLYNYLDTGEFLKHGGSQAFSRALELHLQDPAKHPISPVYKSIINKVLEDEPEVRIHERGSHILPETESGGQAGYMYAFSRGQISMLARKGDDIGDGDKDEIFNFLLYSDAARFNGHSDDLVTWQQQLPEDSPSTITVHGKKFTVFMGPRGYTGSDYNDISKQDIFIVHEAEDRQGKPVAAIEFLTAERVPEHGPVIQELFEYFRNGRSGDFSLATQDYFGNLISQPGMYLTMSQTDDVAHRKMGGHSVSARFDHGVLQTLETQDHSWGSNFSEFYPIATTIDKPTWYAHQYAIPQENLKEGPQAKQSSYAAFKYYDSISDDDSNVIQIAGKKVYVIRELGPHFKSLCLVFAEKRRGGRVLNVIPVQAAEDLQSGVNPSWGSETYAHLMEIERYILSDRRVDLNSETQAVLEDVVGTGRTIKGHSGKRKPKNEILFRASNYFELSEEGERHSKLSYVFEQGGITQYSTVGEAASVIMRFEAYHHSENLDLPSWQEDVDRLLGAQRPQAREPFMHDIAVAPDYIGASQIAVIPEAFQRFNNIGEWFDSLGDDHPSRIPIPGRKVYLLAGGPGTFALMSSVRIDGGDYIQVHDFISKRTFENADEFELGQQLATIVTSQHSHNLSTDQVRIVNSLLEESPYMFFHEGYGNILSPEFVFGVVSQSYSFQNGRIVALENDSSNPEPVLGQNMPITEFNLYSESVAYNGQYTDLLSWFRVLEDDDPSVIYVKGKKYAVLRGPEQSMRERESPHAMLVHESVNEDGKPIAILTPISGANTSSHKEAFKKLIDYFHQEPRPEISAELELFFESVLSHESERLQMGLGDDYAQKLISDKLLVGHFSHGHIQLVGSDDDSWTKVMAEYYPIGVVKELPAWKTNNAYLPHAAPARKRRPSFANNGSIKFFDAIPEDDPNVLMIAGKKVAVLYDKSPARDALCLLFEKTNKGKRVVRFVMIDDYMAAYQKVESLELIYSLQQGILSKQQTDLDPTLMSFLEDIVLHDRPVLDEEKVGKKSPKLFFGSSNTIAVPEKLVPGDKPKWILEQGGVTYYNERGESTSVANRYEPLFPWEHTGSRFKESFEPTGFDRSESIGEWFDHLPDDHSSRLPIACERLYVVGEESQVFLVKKAQYNGHEYIEYYPIYLADLKAPDSYLANQEKALEEIKEVVTGQKTELSADALRHINQSMAATGPAMQFNAMAQQAIKPEILSEHKKGLPIFHRGMLLMAHQDNRNPRKSFVTSVPNILYSEWLTHQQQPETPLEWFRRLPENSPSVLMVDGHKYAIVSNQIALGETSYSVLFEKDLAKGEKGLVMVPINTNDSSGLDEVTQELIQYFQITNHRAHSPRKVEAMLKKLRRVAVKDLPGFVFREGENGAETNREGYDLKIRYYQGQFLFSAHDSSSWQHTLDILSPIASDLKDSHRKTNKRVFFIPGRQESSALAFFESLPLSNPNVLSIEGRKVVVLGTSYAETAAGLAFLFKEKRAGKNVIAFRFLSYVDNHTQELTSDSEIIKMLSNTREHIISAGKTPLDSTVHDKLADYLFRNIDTDGESIPLPTHFDSKGMSELGTAAPRGRTHKFHFEDKGITAYFSHIEGEQTIAERFELLQNTRVQNNSQAFKPQELTLKRIARPWPEKSGLSHLVRFEDPKSRVGVAINFDRDEDGNLLETASGVYVYQRQRSWQGLTPLKFQQILFTGGILKGDDQASFRSITHQMYFMGSDEDPVAFLQRANADNLDQLNLTLLTEFDFDNPVLTTHVGLHKLVDQKEGIEEYDGLKMSVGWLDDQNTLTAFFKVKTKDGKLVDYTQGYKVEIDPDTDKPAKERITVNSHNVTKDSKQEISIEPYKNKQGVPEQYIVSWTHGHARIHVGLDLSSVDDWPAGQRPVFHAKPFLTRIITNPEEVNKAKQKEKYTTAFTKRLKAIHKLTPKDVNSIPISLKAADFRSKGFKKIVTSPIPLEVNFNTPFRDIVKLAAADMRGKPPILTLKFFNQKQTYDYALSWAEQRGSEKVFRLFPKGHTAPPGPMTLIVDKVRGIYRFDFQNTGLPSRFTDMHGWLNRAAFGPQLQVSYDENSNRLSVNTSLDPHGELYFALQQIWGQELALDLGESFEHGDLALELLDDTKTLYEASINEHRRVAKSRRDSVLPARVDVRTYAFPVIRGQEDRAVPAIGLTLGLDINDKDELSDTVRVLGVNSRGVSHDSETVTVFHEGQEVTFPYDVSFPTSLSVVRKTNGIEGWEKVSFDVNSPTDVRLTTDRYIPKDGASYTVDVPTTIETGNGEAPEDVLKLQLTIFDHPVHGKKVTEATLILDSFTESISGVDGVEMPVEEENPEILELNIPYIGRFSYIIENALDESVSGVRFSKTLHYERRHNSDDDKYSLNISGNNTESISPELFTRDVDGEARYFIEAHEQIRFESWLKLMGHKLPDVSRENTFTEVRFGDSGQVSFSPALVVGDVVGTSSISLKGVTLKDAISPPDAVGTTSDTEEPISRMPIRIDESTVLDFEPHEFFVTGDRTIKLFENAFREVALDDGETAIETSLVAGSEYEYELESEAGIILVIPFLWQPENRKSPIMHDSGRRVKAYRKGKSAATATEVSDNRFKVRQDDQGNWRIYVLDAGTEAGKVKTFQIETMRSGLFMGGVETLDDDGDRMESGEIREWKKMARQHNEGSVAKRIGKPIKKVTLPSFVDEEVEKEEGSASVTLRYFAQNERHERWVEIKGLELVNENKELAVMGMVRVQFGVGQGRHKQSDGPELHMVPTAHPEGVSHKVQLVEVLDGQVTGRVFDLDLKSHKFIEILDEPNDNDDSNNADKGFLDAIDEHHIPEFEPQTGTGGHLGSREYQAKTFSPAPVILDEEIMFLPRENREYKYPKPGQITFLREDDAPSILQLQNTLRGLHDAILLPDRETLFGSVLTGGERLVHRFFGPGGVIIELPLKQNEQGHYVASNKIDPDGIIKGGKLLMPRPDKPEEFIEVPTKFRATQVESGTTIEMLAGVGGQQFNLDFEVYRTERTISRTTMALKGIEQGRSQNTERHQIGDVLVDWLRMNQLYGDEYRAIANNDPLALENDTVVDLRVFPRNDHDPFEVSGIAFERDTEGTVVRSYVNVRTSEGEVECPIYRAINQTPTYFIDTPQGLKTAVVSKEGRLLVFDEQPGVSRIASIPQVLRVTMLNKYMERYAAARDTEEVKSAFHVTYQSESDTEITYKVSLLAGRWKKSTAISSDVPKVTFTLVYDRVSDEFTVRPEGQMKTIRNVRDSELVWKDAQVELIKDYHGDQHRIFMKVDPRGYAWIELDNLKAILEDTNLDTTINGTFAHYTYKNHEHVVMPDDVGFLSVLFRMYEECPDAREIFDDALSASGNLFTAAQKEFLLNSEQSFNDFGLFASAVSMVGAEKDQEDFPSQFKALVEAVNVAKKAPVPSGTTGPQDRGTAGSKVRGVEGSMAREMRAFRPIGQLGQVRPVRDFRSVRPKMPMRPLRQNRPPATLRSIDPANHFPIGPSIQPPIGPLTPWNSGTLALNSPALSGMTFMRPIF